MIEQIVIVLSMGLIGMAAGSDPDKQYVLTGKRNQVNAFTIPDFQYTTTGKLIIHRLMNNRDMKILITSKGKTTGTGKTTLAICLARFVNRVRNALFDMNETWRAEDYATIDVWDYLEQYREAKKGDCFIADELEYMTDRRKFMTDENIKFTQAWSILRYKNVVTIGTAPGLSDLEKRVPETADLWINVVYPGQANVYYLTFDDFDWDRIYRRLRKGNFKESIGWADLDKNNDPDYQYLHNEKKELGIPGVDEDSKERIDQSTLNKKEKSLRNQFVKEALKAIHNKDIDTYFTQAEIGDLAGVSQQQVSKLKKELLDSGEL